MPKITKKIKLNPFNSLNFSLLLSPNQKLTFALLWSVARITLGRISKRNKEGACEIEP